MNEWNSFGQGITVTDDSFNDSVSGSKYMGLGTHQGVFIEGIELATSKKGTKYVRIVWNNGKDQIMKDAVFLEGTDKKTGKAVLHFTYRRLASALIRDKALCVEFFGKLLPSNVKLFAGLTGLRANITISEGRKGYTVKDNGFGAYLLYDVETNSQIGSEVYDDYTAAHEAADALGLDRAWNQISDVKPCPEFVDANEQAIRNVISTATKATGSGTNVSPLATGTRGPSL